MHGFCHIEIPTTDAERSKKFYEDVFGWKFQYDPDSDYWLFETGDGPGGGFVKADYIGVGAVLTYILVASVDEAMRRVVAAGGTEIVPKSPVGNMGWFAFFRDPVGVKMAVYEAASKRAAEPKAAAKPARKKAVARKVVKKAAKKPVKKAAAKKVVKKVVKKAAKKPVKKAARKPARKKR